MQTPLPPNYLWATIPIVAVFILFFAALVFMGWIAWGKFTAWLDKREEADEENRRSRDATWHSSQNERDKLMREFWNLQNIALQESIRSVLEVVKSIAGQLEQHDVKTDKAIERMEERTRPRAKRSV